jgi:hypothetical protein
MRHNAGGGVYHRSKRKEQIKQFVSERDEQEKMFGAFKYIVSFKLSQHWMNEPIIIAANSIDKLQAIVYRITVGSEGFSVEDDDIVYSEFVNGRFVPIKD